MERKDVSSSKPHNSETDRQWYQVRFVSAREYTGAPDEIPVTSVYTGDQGKCRWVDIITGRTVQ